MKVENKFITRLVLQFKFIFCPNNFNTFYTSSCKLHNLHLNPKMSFSKKVQEVSARYPNNAEKFIGYGTAGFRDKASVLDHVMFRVGILSALRSKQKNATIGVMITASHNPEEDNGVKLVDPAGEMLENAWEKLATDVANVKDSSLASDLEELINKIGIDVTAKGSVFIARDTRKSSPRLTQAVLDGINCVEYNDVINWGLASTPVLHYLVVCKNGNEAYGKCSKEGYYAKLSSSFSTAMEKELTKGSYKPSLTVDCANGIGAIEMQQVGNRIENVLQLNLVNEGTTGILNHNCGADFVKVQQTFPENVSPVAGGRFASLDGDADRLIYFYFNDNSKFSMLDGDKIALLFAEHLSQLAEKGNLQLKTGIVQTAYANGSSTNYARDVLNIPVACVKTGVKHLHHAAQEFDIGVYFEANGHGTVFFSDKAIAAARSANQSENANVQELAYFIDIINSTVGDAISDLLTVEAILHSKGWSAQDWDNMYTDLPNRQLKVSVADRNVIKTADAERKCVSPDGLQIRIEELAGKYKNGRSFVRPSGTEDIVRVYAEADTQANADMLGKEVATAVYEQCSGVGVKP